MGDATCCQPTCPCARDGKHKGMTVFSAVLGGQFCCRRSYVRAHYMRDKSRYVERATAWNKNNPERRAIIASAHYRKTERGKKDYYLRRTYGISIAQYDSMVMSQCGMCAVCGEFEKSVEASTQQPKRLAVHHDHLTGRVIALLCHNCNRGIGMLGDSIENLRRAAEVHGGK